MLGLCQENAPFARKKTRVPVYFYRCFAVLEDDAAAGRGPAAGGAASGAPAISLPEGAVRAGAKLRHRPAGGHAQKLAPGAGRHAGERAGPIRWNVLDVVAVNPKPAGELRGSALLCRSSSGEQLARLPLGRGHARAAACVPCTCCECDCPFIRHGSGSSAGHVANLPAVLCVPESGKQKAPVPGRRNR